MFAYLMYYVVLNFTIFHLEKLAIKCINQKDHISVKSCAKHEISEKEKVKY